MIAYLADGWVEIAEDRYWRLNLPQEDHDPGVLPDRLHPDRLHPKKIEEPEVRELVRLLCVRWQKHCARR